MRQTSTRDARRDATMDATTNGTGTTVSDASVPAKTYPRIGGGDGRGGDPWTTVDVS